MTQPAAAADDDRIALDDPVEQQAWTTLVGDATGDTGALLAVSHFRLSGIDCAACAPRVEAALLAVPGVRRAEVSAAGRQLAVTWCRGETAPSRLVDAVARAGFEAVPDAAQSARAQRRRARRRSVWQLFVAVFCSMQVMMYAAPLYGAAPGDVAPDLRQLLLWASWLLSVPVLVFSAGPWLRGAWQGLRQREVRMELPVALGIVVAFAASSWAVLDPVGAAGDGDVWFDSLTMFVAALLAARWLQAVAHDRVASALEEAVERVPRTARRLDGTCGDRETVVPLHALRAGDLVRVRAGEPFPADGPIEAGATEVDESLLTGESRGVARRVGDAVLAGSLNLAGPVTQRVRALGLDTRQAQIVALLRSATGARPALVRLADRWAGPFLVGVLLLAALAALGWWFVEPARAVPVAVAVLIVTCPCALALAAPVAQLAAAGALARRGVLLARLDALEPAAAFTRVVFDKTGTLTGAALRLVRWAPLPAVARTRADALALATSLAAASAHPRSVVIAAAAREASLAGGDGAPGAVAWRTLAEVPGAGVEGLLADGTRVRLGARRWACGHADAHADVHEDNHTEDPAKRTDALGPSNAPDGAVWLADAHGPLAWFELGESLRPDAAASVADLRRAGLAVAMLSGDAASRVQSIGAALGLAAADVHGGLAPEAKLAAMAAWQAQGERVAMVGDGINDAPVLARADVSFALASGSALARASADVVLLSGRIGDVVETRRLAHRTLAVIRQNLAFSVAYNVCMVPLAVLGACPPWLAGLGMALSSLVVVLNALRVGRTARADTTAAAATAATRAAARSTTPPEAALA